MMRALTFGFLLIKRMDTVMAIRAKRVILYHPRTEVTFAPNARYFTILEQRLMPLKARSLEAHDPHMRILPVVLLEHVH